jgi:hypothetical protein
MYRKQENKEKRSFVFVAVAAVVCCFFSNEIRRKK